MSNPKEEGAQTVPAAEPPVNLTGRNITQQPEKINPEKPLFKIGVNQTVQGKVDFQTNAHARWELTYNYLVCEYGIPGLAEEIKRRSNFVNLCFDEKGEFHRKKDNYKSGQVLFIDIDNDDEKVDAEGNKQKVRATEDDYWALEQALNDPFLMKYAALIYTTPSHSEEWNRFRIVFVLPEPITDAGEFESIAIPYIWKFGGDEACKDACRLYYGTGENGFVHTYGNYLDKEIIQAVRDEYEATMNKSHSSSEDECKDAKGSHAKSKALKIARKIINESRRGTRHAARTKAAFFLGGCVASGILTEEEAIEGIRASLEANTDNPDATWKTIYECMEAGKKEPIDKRSFTSTQNGKKGGRPSIDLTGLVKKFRDQQPYPVYFFRGAWYKFNGRYYQEIPWKDMESCVVSWLQNELPETRISTPLKNDFLLNLRAEGLCYLPSSFEIPSWITNGQHAPYCLAMENLVVDVDKLVQVMMNPSCGETWNHPLNPDFFSTYGTDFAYDPNAQCPKWKKYLSEAQPLPSGQDIIQMMFGLSLIPDTRYEVAFYLIGKGGNGKNVCLDVLANLMGTENVACVLLSRFFQRFALHALTTHRLNIVGDMPTASESSTTGAIEGAFKDIVSGGLIDCEKKGQDIYTAKAIALNIFSANSLTVFSDRSEGIWQRLRIIPFNVCFRNTPRDNKFLKDEIIAEELPGIFIWALQGLVKLRKLGQFPEHPEGLILKEEHRASCDHERTFLLESVREKIDGSVLSVDLYFMYREWMRQNGYRSCGEARFAQAVTRVCSSVEKGRKQNGSKRCQCWHGIEVINNNMTGLTGWNIAS